MGYVHSQRRENMLGQIHGQVLYKEPMGFHTSLRIGGPADIFIRPIDVGDIRHALLFATRESLPITTIGAGSSLLVKDRGVRGIVLKLAGCLGRAEFRGNEVTAGAGMMLSELIQSTAAVNLGSIECLAGIPATIGGALAMNAGTPEGAIGDFVKAVYFLYPDGTLGEFKPSNGFSYSQFVLMPGSIIISCRLQLKQKPVVKIKKDIRDRGKRRKATEPFWSSAAVMWKNPLGKTAAQLITDAGIRDRRTDTVEILAKHPNFIVNRGGATAADVLALMGLTRKRVHAHSGIMLEPAIHIIGE